MNLRRATLAAVGGWCDLTAACLLEVCGQWCVGGACEDGQADAPADDRRALGCLRVGQVGEFIVGEAGDERAQVGVLEHGVDLARTVTSLRTARRYGSPALRSNGFHFAGDMAGSLAVLIGLLLVRAGFMRGDASAALVIAAIILATATRLIVENANVLMDRTPAEAREAAERALARLEPNIELVRLRLRESAGRYFADVVAAVAPGAAVVEGHQAANLIEAAIETELPGSDVVVHIEPRRSGLDLRDRAGPAAAKPANNPSTLTSSPSITHPDKMSEPNKALLVIEDLRRDGPRPTDTEWRAVRAEQAKRQALGSPPSPLVVSNGPHPRGKICGWLDVHGATDTEGVAGFPVDTAAFERGTGEADPNAETPASRLAEVDLVGDELEVLDVVGHQRHAVDVGGRRDCQVHRSTPWRSSALGDERVQPPTLACYGSVER